jgi:hypothetical protein
MATASSVTDALINNLSAASVIGSCRVKTHYAVLESGSQAGVVQWLSDETERVQFANGRQITMSHSLRLYVKDLSGNAKLIERQTQQLRDISACSLWADPNLQHGSNPETVTVDSIAFARDLDTAFDTGGATWYLVDGVITTVLWPDNV